MMSALASNYSGAEPGVPEGARRWVPHAVLGALVLAKKDS